MVLVTGTLVGGTGSQYNDREGHVINNVVIYPVGDLSERLVSPSCVILLYR